MAAQITIHTLDPADIELVGPLWKQLLDHIAALPGAIVPVRPSDESWPLERAEMLASLGDDAFVLLARRDGNVVGYVFVVIEGPDPVWYTGDTHAEIRHLCVTATERGKGVGRALLDALDAELERRGVEDVEIGVDPANHDAVRLYESRGYADDFHVLYGSPGRKAWACLRREAEDRRAGRGRFSTPGPEQPPANAGGEESVAMATAPVRYVSVVGQSADDDRVNRLGEELGERLAAAGCVVICGGMGGVMSAVARGVARGEGVCIGILPGLDRRAADPHLTYSVCTGIGHARNLTVAASGDVVIALGGSWGTLSEIALARCAGRTVIALDSWDVRPREGEPEGILHASSPADAVKLACRALAPGERTE
jgi:uncharacterized protein (TIGR00725 family)